MDTPGSNLSPEVGVWHSSLEWEGSAQQKGLHSRLVYIIKNNTHCRRPCGKFRAHPWKQKSLYFISMSSVLHTHPSRVKSCQSLSGVEPISSSLNDIMPPMGQSWQGPGSGTRPGRPPSWVLPLRFSRRHSRAQGPLSYHFR